MGMIYFKYNANLPDNIKPFMLILYSIVIFYYQ